MTLTPAWRRMRDHRNFSFARVIRGSISVIQMTGRTNSWPHCDWAWLSTLRNRRSGVCGDGDFYLCALFKTHFVAIFVGQSIFDAKLSIKMVGPFDGDLSFLRNAWRWRLDDLLNRGSHSGAGFIAHGSLL